MRRSGGSGHAESVQVAPDILGLLAYGIICFVIATGYSASSKKRRKHQSSL
jgi:hypothetical protein